MTISTILLGFSLVPPWIAACPLPLVSTHIIYVVFSPATHLAQLISYLATKKPISKTIYEILSYFRKLTSSQVLLQLSQLRHKLQLHLLVFLDTFSVEFPVDNIRNTLLMAEISLKFIITW